jgi:hypothetical protein
MFLPLSIPAPAGINREAHESFAKNRGRDIGKSANADDLRTERLASCR